MWLPGPISSSALSSLSPLSLAGCSSQGGFERWDWRALAFPYSEKTICSYPIIICHNSYLTAFIWFTPRVMMHVIRTRHHRLVLHCKCNHFFEGKHLSSHPLTPVFPMPHCLFHATTVTLPKPPLWPPCTSLSHLYRTNFTLRTNSNTVWFCGLFWLENYQMVS